MTSKVSEQITILCPCIKTYTVERKPFRGEIYSGAVTGIAEWFYQNNNSEDNINIIIHGSIHETFPQDPHLTVQFETSTTTSNKIHLAFNIEQGYWYQQQRSDLQQFSPYMNHGTVFYNQSAFSGGNIHKRKTNHKRKKKYTKKKIY